MHHNKYIVTITDSKGSRQYSIHKIVKKVIIYSVLSFILIGVLTYAYIKYMHSKADTLRTQMVSLKEERKNIQSQNDALVNLIQENNDKLTSMQRYLKEVEDIIGLGPDRENNIEERVEKIRQHEVEQVVRLTKEVAKTAKQEKVSTIQKALVLNGIPNGKPLKYRRISSNFGYRTHPVTKKKSFHAGLDLPAKYGTPIYAPASGVVVMAQKKGAYGNFLLLTHAYGFKTAYGHLSKFAVRSGEFVNKGQVIAYVGSTGRSTGPHLHYEVRYLTKWLNPTSFMFWDTKNINSILAKEEKVNWNSIFKQTKRLMILSIQ
jgi:murein DD-endopeptidase MepM/ murein hydrolase activator NlpD